MAVDRRVMCSPSPEQLLPVDARHAHAKPANGKNDVGGSAKYIGLKFCMRVKAARILPPLPEVAGQRPDRYG